MNVYILVATGTYKHFEGTHWILCSHAFLTNDMAQAHISEFKSQVIDSDKLTDLRDDESLKIHIISLKVMT